MDFLEARGISTGHFDWNGKSVLVTGGAGFVGSYLVEDLVFAGANVRVVDDLSTGSLERLKNVHDEIEFIRADLTDRESARKSVQGSNVVLHLAAKAYGMLYSMSHNFEVLRDNVLMSTNVLDSCVEFDVERALMVSSSCVYDDASPIPTPELPVHLGLPESVNEGYGWAKRMLEIESGYAHREFGLSLAIVRPFNAYGGRYQWQGDASHVVPSLVKKVLDRSSPVVIWGSGEQVRDLLHARDFALGFRLAVERITDGEVINLAGGTTIRLVDLVERIGEVAGIRFEIAFDLSKAEGRPHKEADLTKLHQLVPEFSQTVSLDDGLKDMIEWYEASSAQGLF
jgi:GDP-L-fucose synthase